METTFEHTVKKLLETALEANPALFLVALEVSPSNQIKVIIDGDKGVTVQDCITISRAIEHNLDRDQVDFSLEVLSAGVSNPLQHYRQYPKNKGRKLKVKTNTDTFEGTLQEVTPEGITLSWKTREPKPIGKGKHTVQKQAQLTFEEIEEAKVMITF